MNKKLLFSILLCLGFISTSFSQQTSDSFSDHLRYGGSFNVGFSNNYTTIGISPSSIYDFYNGFAAGLSLSYFHTKQKGLHNTYTSNVYGGSIITLYSPLTYLQLSAELEELNVHRKESFFDPDPYWLTSLYLGVAYQTGAISFGIRYDVLYDNNDFNNIYGSSVSPVFRVYF